MKKALNACFVDSVVKELEVENRYLKDIVALIPANIYFVDTNGKCKFCNHNLARLMGFSNNEDVVGRCIYDLLPAPIRDKTKENNSQIIKTKAAQQFEEQGFNIQGMPATYLTHKTPFLNDRGNAIGVIGVSIDITDHKRAERLQQEKEIAEKLANFATSIAGSIAHEMKHPLAGINLQLDILSGELASANLPPEKAQSCTSIIKMSKQAIKGAVHVISDMLLKIKSFATGKVHYDDFVKTSIASDIDTILDTFPFDENEKERIELKNFEKISSRFQYLGDTTFTQHVLSNLLRNALYAVRIENKGKLIIELQSGKPFNKLIFKDTAGSLSKETAAKIFNHFESKKGHSGTGLGLSFCKMVMQEYGGNIECNVEEGKFTEFVLSFPAL